MRIVTERIEIRHRFSPLVERMDREGDNLAIQRLNFTPITFAAPDTHCAEALMLLDGTGTTRQNLITNAGVGDNSNATETIDYYLGRFCYGRLLKWDITLDGESIVRISSQDRQFGPNETETPPQNFAFPRFAWLRRDGEDMILESAESRGRMILSSRAIALLGDLSETPEDEVTRAFGAALWRFGFLEDASATESPARKTWQFHDKLIHEMSRFNFDDTTPGATYRFKDVMPSPPALKPDMLGTPIQLPEIDVGKIGQNSASLHDIMDRRISGRDYGTSILSLADLASFLYRVARTDKVNPDPSQDTLSRPFPSGGSIHELEFYVAVRQCEGLTPGLYHYQGQNHRLLHLPDSETASQQMHMISAACMGQTDSPADTLIVITSRLPRIAWKYETISYRTSLLNAGVALQTMYLVATDMGLQGCANGLGDSRLFEAATGLDPFEETAITEFALSAAS